MAGDQGDRGDAVTTGNGGFPEFPGFGDPDLLDAIAELEADIEDRPEVLGVEDEPDPRIGRPPPGPRDEDGPQDVDPVEGETGADG